MLIPRERPQMIEVDSVSTRLLCDQREFSVGRKEKELTIGESQDSSVCEAQLAEVLVSNHVPGRATSFVDRLDRLPEHGTKGAQRFELRGQVADFGEHVPGAEDL